MKLKLTSETDIVNTLIYIKDKLEGANQLELADMLDQIKDKMIADKFSSQLKPLVILPSETEVRNEALNLFASGRQQNTVLYRTGFIRGGLWMIEQARST